MSYKYAIGEKVRSDDHTGAEYVVRGRSYAYENHRRRNTYDIVSAERPNGWISTLGEERLRPAMPRCMVCLVEFKPEGGLIPRHEDEGKICYGSFVPCPEVK